MRSLCRKAAVLIAAAAALWGAGLPAARAQSIYTATITTTGLSGTSGLLAFDFTGGDSASSNNSVLISAFATDGALAGGSNTSIGGASGDLPGDVSLTDSAFLNRSARGITLGTSLSFTLTLSQNFAGGSPDEFSFFLRNPAGTASVVTTGDPTGADALFAIDITGQAEGSLTVYNALTPGVASTVASDVIPEPATGALLAPALLALCGMVSRQRRLARR
jgi:hypothetical protein